MRRVPAEDVELARQEPIVMKDLHHEHILRLFDYFEEDHQMHMIYERHESSLMARIKELQGEKEVMPEQEKWRHFVQIAYVLRYLSNKRIIHRMLNTKKMLFDKDGKLKVTALQFSCVVGSKFKVCQSYYPTM